MDIKREEEFVSVKLEQREDAWLSLSEGSIANGHPFEALSSSSITPFSSVQQRDSQRPQSIPTLASAAHHDHSATGYGGTRQNAALPPPWPSYSLEYDNSIRRDISRIYDGSSILPIPTRNEEKRRRRELQDWEDMSGGPSAAPHNFTSRKEEELRMSSNQQEHVERKE